MLRHRGNGEIRPRASAEVERSLDRDRANLKASGRTEPAGNAAVRPQCGF